MTDRIRTLTVLLEHDMRDDDVQVVVDAIRMIRYVAKVEHGRVDVGDWSAREIAKLELRAKLWELLK